MQVTLVCPTCQIEFLEFQSHANRRVYCSHSCRAGIMADGRKLCTECGEAKPLDQFHRRKDSPSGAVSKCRACSQERRRAKQRRRYEKDPTRVSRRIRGGGMTKADYEARVAVQGGLCQLCRCPPKGCVNLSIDHDHSTGRVRGLLCRSCNSALGMAKDDPKLLRVAATYLLDPPFAGLGLTDPRHNAKVAGSLRS